MPEPDEERKPIVLVCSQCGTRADYVIAPVTLSDGSMAKGTLTDWHFVICDYQQWAGGYAVTRLLCPTCFAGCAGVFYVHLPTWLSP